MATQKEKNNKKLLIGGALAAALAWWLWPKASTATTTAATTQATVPPTTVAVTSTAVTPTPTYSNTINFQFTNVQVNPTNYSLQLSFIVTNDTPNPVTLTSIAGSVFFAAIPASQLYTDPGSLSDKLGTVNWPLFNGTAYDTPQVIQPGKNYTRWIPVEVPETAEAKWRLQNLNLSLAGNSGIQDQACNFSGTAQVNGQSLPFNVNFEV